MPTQTLTPVIISLAEPGEWTERQIPAGMPISTDPLWHPDTFIEFHDTGAIVFWCDAEPRGRIAGCHITKNFWLCWRGHYATHAASFFDHMPSVEECEEEFRELRRSLGVDPLTGKWSRA